MEKVNNSKVSVSKVRKTYVIEVTRSQMYYLYLENQNGHSVFKLDKPGFTQLIRGLHLPT